MATKQNRQLDKLGTRSIILLAIGGVLLILGLIMGCLIAAAETTLNIETMMIFTLIGAGGLLSIIGFCLFLAYGKVRKN